MNERMNSIRTHLSHAYAFETNCSELNVWSPSVFIDLTVV